MTATNDKYKITLIDPDTNSPKDIKALSPFQPIRSLGTYQCIGEHQKHQLKVLKEKSLHHA